MKAEMRADGFNGNTRGRAIDVLLISSLNVIRWPATTRRKLSRDELSLAGRIRFGMTRMEAMHAIRGLGPFPSKVGDKWAWRQKGFLRLRPGGWDTFKNWTATIKFERGRVAEICVWCS